MDSEKINKLIWNKKMGLFIAQLFFFHFFLSRSIEILIESNFKQHEKMLFLGNSRTVLKFKIYKQSSGDFQWF